MLAGKQQITIAKVDDLPHANDKIKWLVDGVIKEGTFNSIIGSAKAGKSQLSIQLAFSLINNIDFLDTFKVNPCQVLYVDFELEDNEIKQRWDGIRSFYEMSDAGQAYYMPLKSYFASGIVNMDVVISEVKKFKKDHPDIKLVIFDCFYAFSKGDGNKEEDVWASLQPLKALSGVENDLTVIYVHHTTKKSFKEGDDPIYAAGGSGVHGKSVDTSILVYGQKSSSPIKKITSAGRSSRFDPISCHMDAETHYFFKPFDSRYDEDDETIENNVTADELRERYPKCCALIDASSYGYITNNSRSWDEAAKEELGRNSVDVVQEVGFIWNRKTRHVSLPKD